MTVKVSSELLPPGVENSSKHPAEEEIRRRRERLFAQADEQARPQMDLGTTEEPHTPREDVELVEIELPDGRHVVLGPPPGVSLTMRNALMFGAETPNRLVSSLVRLMHCIRTIDGKTVPVINNMVDAQALANALGDQAIDLLFTVLAEYWPAPTVRDLKIVRKSVRHQNSAS